MGETRSDTLHRWIVEVDGERYAYATRERARWAADHLTRRTGEVERDRGRCWVQVYPSDGIARVVDRRRLRVDHETGAWVAWVAGR